ncbi:hypothetical protein P8C59_003610 [Phyllachora maydis]|uniref:Partial AB-hydrolase lipase domain-containing protein n=1 Tax=Phyllachora maydis TaxID=1825666 RepID=A0AAD9MBL5_9PEZI|nr:hypothetical protein P8C59_003610 [Phyllachora maydis]
MVLQERRDSGSTSTLARSQDSLEMAAVQYAEQAEKLSLKPRQEGGDSEDVAVSATFVTPYDPVIVTSGNDRLPGAPLAEAHKLNMLQEKLRTSKPETDTVAAEQQQSRPGKEDVLQGSMDARLNKATAPSHTNPLFPPLPLYGPPSVLRKLHCYAFRASSFVLSLAFLGAIVLGSLFASVPPFCHGVYSRMTFRNPDGARPFYQEELRRKEARQAQEKRWRRRKSDAKARLQEDKEGSDGDDGGFTPTEGGTDTLVCDAAYYARRVGLDVEKFHVETEDGFIIELWHVYDPAEYQALPVDQRACRGPAVFGPPRNGREAGGGDKKPKFPVLLMHGLLQSSGAYCVNDDDSLAFYLCKSGYDVWLGNNRCGFRPKHALLEYSDPRMWCWNIRQMGVFDLAALTSRVLYETGFRKIGLVCHSQGTTQTFVALAKEQRPELGERLTVFCALAPAVYAGPLIGKMYFKFMRIISPGMFRLMFGIHAFIPFMMTMHQRLHPRVYGWLGYKVFSFLFDWTDARWDRGLRDRMFQFAPVYVSAESMRWWLGRECFAKQKCILATEEQWRAEEREDKDEAADPRDCEGRAAGATAWYNAQAPPFALWVCGRDALVDGDRLLRRFARGREPHVDVVHTKVLADYEHLDVIWAMDAPRQVFCEVREVLWKTCDVRDACRVPVGCEGGI